VVRFQLEYNGSLSLLFTCRRFANFRRGPITAIAGQPAQRTYQFRGELHATRTDFKTALKYFALATDHIQKTARRLGIKDIAPLIFDLFETTAPTLQAAAVPL